MPLPFLDANIILRHLLGDSNDQSPKATAFLNKVETGEIAVLTSEIVIFEVVFTLERTYKRTKKEIREAVLSIIEWPSLNLPGKSYFDRIFDLYLDLNIPFPDAHHVVTMERSGSREIITFDKHFDKVSSIQRTEP